MRKIFLPLLLVALSPVAHSEGVQEVEIDAPLSGWHPAEGEDASFSQTINYPASSVNMADDQNISAQIRGKIKNYAAAGPCRDIHIQCTTVFQHGVTVPGMFTVRRNDMKIEVGIVRIPRENQP